MIERNTEAKTRVGDAQEFIANAVDYDNPDVCLEWPFYTNKCGYGCVRHRGKASLAHRIVCMMAHGKPLSDDLEAAHNCGNRSCCNPHHLQWKTHRENSLDKKVHGTEYIPSGEDHPRAKLTAADVKEIREQLGVVAQAEIARRYRVSPQTISAIKTGVNWAH